jgi:hypothetical protein
VAELRTSGGLARTARALEAQLEHQIANHPDSLVPIQTLAVASLPLPPGARPVARRRSALAPSRCPAVDRAGRDELERGGDKSVAQSKKASPPPGSPPADAGRRRRRRRTVRRRHDHGRWGQRHRREPIGRRAARRAGKVVVAVPSYRRPRHGQRAEGAQLVGPPPQPLKRLCQPPAIRVASTSALNP